ncbi:hypothetical protein N752_25630 [Desulforamulus aquiferis]|nr:hypothetical protein [Desulforamulus aquiferis]RYD02336.1 hypothetical protein N752_25630 [Desulforamulus aquiferis]
MPDVILSTLSNNTQVSKGEMLAGTKVIPLVVPEQVISSAEKAAAASMGVVKVLPFSKRRWGSSLQAVKFLKAE